MEGNSTGAPAAPANTTTAPAAAPAPAAPAAPVAPAPLTYPEGAQFDESIKASFEALHAGKVSSQEFVNAFFKRGQELTAARAQKAETDKAAQIQKWSDEMTMDPTFGGPKLAQTTQAVDRAMRHLAPDGSLEARLKELGIDGDPVFRRALARLGMTLAEDSIAGTARPSVETVDPQKSMIKEMFGQFL